MRSRLLLPLLILLTWLASCGKKENEFTVIGKISNMPPQHVYLEELNPITDAIIVDSGKTDAQGNFELSGIAPEPGLYRLRFEQNEFMLLSIDKGTLKITADWQNLDAHTITGSAPSIALSRFLMTVREHLRDFNTMSVVLDTLQARGNDSMLRAASEDMQEMKAGFVRYIEQYADTTRYLPNALFAVQMLNPAVEGEYLNMFTQNIVGKYPDSKLARDFNIKMTKMLGAASQPAVKGVPVGATAPEITLPDPAGTEVRLSSFKGKYVLVDFWASWCGPCRGENPNVVAAFNQFKDKNFTILGVSLDSDRDKWKEAIKKDQLTWTHISDLKGWESIAARDYAVESIPANFLVDPQGKVVARDLRGDALTAKLAEILQ